MSSRPTIPCPSCARDLVIRVDQIGHRVACKFCDHVFRIPTRVGVPCPKCGVEGHARTEALGQTVQCQDCGHPFLALITTLPGAKKPAVVVAAAATPTSAALEAMRGELASAIRQRDEAQAHLLAMDMRWDELESALRVAREELAAVAPMGRDLATLRAERDGLQTSLLDVRAELDGMRAERDGLKDRLAGIDAEIAAHRDRAAQAGASVDVLQSRLASTQGESAAIRSEHDALKNRLARLHEELAEIRRQATAARPADDELTALRAERDELRDVATEAIERAGWQAERIQSLTRALESARDEIGRLKDEAQSTGEELRGLRYRVGKQESLEAERTALADEVSSLRHERNQANARLEVVAGEVERAVNEARARWDAERGIPRSEPTRERTTPARDDAEIARLIAERDAALQRLEDLESETFQGLPRPSNPQPAAPQVAALQKQVRALEDERNELALRLGAAEADREALLFAQTDRRLIARSDAFRKFGPQGDPDLAEAKAKLEAESKKVQSLQADLEAAQKRIQELSHEAEATEFGAEDPRARMRNPDDTIPSTIVPLKQEAG